MKEYMSDHQVSGKVLPFNPSGEFYFSKGLDSFHKYDFEQARKYLSRALEFEPKHPVITCHLAIVLAEMGEYEQSNELLHKILYELNAYMYECHYFMANNYAYLGMYNKAIKHIKFYLQDAPNGQYARDARELLEVISLESEDFTTSYFETDDLTTEDEIITRQEKSRKLLEQGKTEEAIVLLEEMIKDYPTFWPAHNNLALAYFYEGAIEKAQRIIDRVLEESPGNLHAICNLTVFYFYQGKDIEPYVDMLKKIKPISSDHRFKLAVTFIILEKYEEGYSWLKKILQDGVPEEAGFYYWFSYAAYFIGKTDLAEKAWKKVLLLNPEKAGSEPWNVKE